MVSLAARQLPIDEIAALSGSVDVGLKRLALRFDRPGEADFDAVATPRKVSCHAQGAAGPVSGRRRLGARERRGGRLDKLAVAMLDATPMVSGSFA